MAVDRIKVVVTAVDGNQVRYRLEPNMTFTPDGKWVVFRGNFEGATHIYAVEVAKPATP